jgi:asparagine synthetase B (glutamine-hydrolysing)
MPGLFGVFGNPETEQSDAALIETINPVLFNESRVSDFQYGKMGISWLPGNPLGNSVHVEDDRTACFFCGDLIDYPRVPWEGIMEGLRSENYGYFKRLKGVFVFAVYDKESGYLHLISDRLSQQPVYYVLSDNGFLFSTAIQTLCRLMASPRFSREWLYEFIYFNFPVGDTTPLIGVSRVPPSSILSVRLDSMKSSITSYSEPFSRAGSLLKGQRGMERALKVFQERLPKYYPENGDVAVSLTAGFDSRTVLSFSPAGMKDRMLTYTYGVPGCYDLLEAAETAETLGLKHRGIHFDDTFRQKLRDLIHETVFLSGGLEKAHRSTLTYVYRTLTGNGKLFPVTLTGLSGDHLFRDHINGQGNVPAIISADMMDTIQTGEVSINNDLYAGAFRERYSDFRDYVHHTMEELAGCHGELRDPGAYLRYLVYEAAPKYFGGELSIANHFTTLRSPFWDPDIVTLAFEIEYGTLGFSESLPRKDKYREKVMQAYLIANSIETAGYRIGGVPIRAFTCNNRLVYEMMRLLWKIPGKIRGLRNPRRYSPLEDWSTWLRSSDGGGTGDLLGGETMLSDHLSVDFINSIRQGNDIVLLGKLITAETILRLIDQGWVKASSGTD